MPNYDTCTRNKSGNVKNRTNLGNKWEENTKENSWKNKNRRRREWDEHVTRLDAERLFKISRDKIPAGRKSPGRPKRRWNELISD